MSKLILFTLLTLPFYTVAEGINKWIDKDGKVHYGQVQPKSQQSETLDFKGEAPEITPGEVELREKNTQYFNQLYEDRMRRDRELDARNKRLREKSKTTSYYGGSSGIKIHRFWKASSIHTIALIEVNGEKKIKCVAFDGLKPVAATSWKVSRIEEVILTTNEYTDKISKVVCE